MKKTTRLTALLLAIVLLLGTLSASAMETTDGFPVSELDMDKYATIKEDAYRDPVISEGGTVIDYAAESAREESDGEIYLETREMTVSMKKESGAEETDVLLPLHGMVMLKADTDAACKWQIYIADQWVSISGENSAEFALTFAKIKTAYEMTGAAKVRCVGANGTVSDVLNVQMDNMAAAIPELNDELAMAASAYARSSDISLLDGAMEVQEKAEEVYYVNVNYVYLEGVNNGEVAADPWQARLHKGESLNQKVNLPVIEGYKVYMSEEDIANLPAGVTYNAPGEGSNGSVEINISNIAQTYTITVHYKPTEVNYKVRYLLQNANDDDYTADPKGLEEKTGLTGSLIADVNKEYPGYTQLLYEKPTIAADGSTIVEVYYDREYYLIRFDIGEGAYGTEPIYARYGSDIGSVQVPTRPGYKFVGWAESPDSTETVTLPATMPLNGATYYAVWEEEENTKYTVVYWLENADAPEDASDLERYDYWASFEETAATGATVYGEQYKDYAKFEDKFDVKLDEEEKKYSTFAKVDEKITVAGDGTSVINVYYNRKEYTLKFYYAMSSGSGDTAKYYVIGGTTYYFGVHDGSTASDKGDEISLLNQYMTGDDPGNQRGEVKSLPVLNEKGKNRNYTLGSDTSSVTSGTSGSTTYNYYYISFTAKYGADLSNLWPCDVFESVEINENRYYNKWQGTEAFVSAWNGEHHVYYSQTNTNQTIKGNYLELDYKLLWADGFGDSDTVAYLCFWENGADINWSVPELYRYNIYVSPLEGLDMTGMEQRTYRGKTYILKDQYNTIDDSDVNSQTPPAIKGFTYVGTDFSVISEFDKNQYSEAYDMFFFYTRNTYSLQFSSGGEIIDELTQNEVQYNADLSEMMMGVAAQSELIYPEKLEPEAYEFAGWYTTPKCIDGTEFDLADMPDRNLVLYAKWVPVERNVTFYMDLTAWVNDTPLDDDDEYQLQVDDYYQSYHRLVQHGLMLEEDDIPEAPENGDYEFIGWFYMDGEVEKAFDFNTMPVKKDLKVYAKWNEKVLKLYKVYYMVEGTQDYIGETTYYVADLTEGSGLANTTKTFNAKGGDELYADYRNKYFPLVQSHSFVLDAESTEATTYVFEYRKADNVPYLVKYICMNEDGTIAEVQTKVVAENTLSVVSESFKVISGWMPDAYQKQLVVSYPDGKTKGMDGDGDGEEDWIYVTDENGNVVKIDPDNVLEFVYTKDEENAPYRIAHYQQDIPTGTNSAATYTEVSSLQSIDELGSIITAEPHDYSGFAYSHAEIVQGDQVKTVNGSEISAELGAEGLEIRLYYTRKQYRYKVRYLDADTGLPVAEETTNDENGFFLKGYYEQVVSAVAKNIPNYMLNDANQKTDKIAIEGEGEPVYNIITFYYKENTTTINYVMVGPDGSAVEGTSAAFGTLTDDSESIKVVNGTAMGSSAAAKEPYRFIGWYLDESCEQPVEDEAWLSGDRIVPQKVDGAYHKATYYALFDWNLGNLVIRKDVQVENEATTAEPPADDTFTFTITLTPQDGVELAEAYYYAIAADSDLDVDADPVGEEEADGTEEDIVFEVPAGQTKHTLSLTKDADGSSVGTITLKAGEEATIYGLPALTAYAIAEADKDYYIEPDPSSGEGCEVPAGDANGEVFVNTYTKLKDGDLEIKKIVKDSEYKGDKSFSFTVEQVGASEVGKQQFAERITALAAANQAVVTMNSDGAAIVNITVDESKTASFTLTDMPIGSYKVTEAAAEGEGYSYSTGYEPADQTAAVTADGIVTITVTNTATGTRTVLAKKVWEDHEDLFGLRPENVTVTLSGNVITRELTLNEANGWKGEWTDVPMFTAEGELIAYTVSENTVSGYKAAVITGDADTGFTVTNELELGSLKITKTGILDVDHHDASGNAEEERQSSIFRVQGVSGTNTAGINLEVAIEGNGSTTVGFLPAGEYTVTEKTGWSWRYDPVENGKSVTVTANGTANVGFTNTRSNEKWLSGDCYKENAFGEAND